MKTWKWGCYVLYLICCIIMTHRYGWPAGLLTILTSAFFSGYCLMKKEEERDGDEDDRKRDKNVGR